MLFHGLGAVFLFNLKYSNNIARLTLLTKIEQKEGSGSILRSSGSTFHTAEDKEQPENLLSGIFHQ